MNETIKNIINRRSVRQYKQEMPLDSEIDVVMQAGLAAPSAKNRQGSYIALIKGQQNIDKITAVMKAATLAGRNDSERVYEKIAANEKYTVNYGAPLFAIVASDKQYFTAASDVAVILQNMFLAAYSVGIGSVWINQLNTINEVPVFRRFLQTLGVPDNFNVYGSAAFGYPLNGFPENIAIKEGRLKIFSQI